MITIVWHGHSCFEISNENVTLVTDPHDGSSIGIQPPHVKADVVLVSHDHYDHNKVKAVEKETTTVVKGGDTTVRDIRVASYISYHDKEEGKKRGINNIFTFVVDGITFCHLGDLGHLPDEETLSAIGQVDVLFVPVGGVFTIDSREALALCKKIKPRVVIPMHYRVSGLSLPIERVEEFLELAKKMCYIRHVANEIEIDHEDLPEEHEVWVFTL
ncbi:MAG TPA: Zn-dependent hydrolase [Thermoplasmatales archaeon]|nr:Zn-dependent hydrolase [Thermoplasmatales archaeon]